MFKKKFTDVQEKLCQENEKGGYWRSKRWRILPYLLAWFPKLHFGMKDRLPEDTRGGNRRLPVQTLSKTNHWPLGTKDSTMRA